MIAIFFNPGRSRDEALINRTRLARKNFRASSPRLLTILILLGASVVNIVNLLSKEFLSLVLLSFLVAAPVAGYFMHEWLQGFAYKIDLSWWIFAMAGGAALFIALITISIEAIQSAVVNPVKSLKAVTSN